MIEPDVAVPRDLGEVGQALWGRVMAEYQIVDSGGLELLAQACRAADRAARCQKAINLDGELVEQAKGGTREHALLKHELGNRAFVVSTLTKLGLNLEPLKAHAGRPPNRGI
jgi:hypothetical protein